LAVIVPGKAKPIPVICDAVTGARLTFDNWNVMVVAVSDVILMVALRFGSVSPTTVIESAFAVTADPTHTIASARNPTANFLALTNIPSLRYFLLRLFRQHQCQTLTGWSKGQLCEEAFTGQDKSNWCARRNDCRKKYKSL
jgi:hypothetical protein